MGCSIRTDRWRFTEWKKGKETVALELYDHWDDPAENVNLADRTEHAPLIEILKKQLGRGWQAARPK